MGEALTSSLEGIAAVRPFPTGRGDTDGLLRALRPDAVVVDTDEEAAAASSFARETNSPLIHISLVRRKLRVLKGGNWEEFEQRYASPEAIRNAIVGGLWGTSAL